ncbi:MAG: bifunctional adenosylcobinamide kinase/adenosylcobinamide-phosphate guanylyltransferase [Desulfatitalea sp.]
MKPTTFIIGGCRSGKSRQALLLGNSMEGPRKRKLFIATCVPQDTEMHDRVRRHQQERGPQWQTLEVPIELAQAIAQQGAAANLILVDCLTLWVSNMMLAYEHESEINSRIDQLCGLLQAPPCPIILVSNEVGAGIVPENHLARRFRDQVGRINQQVAAACQSVVWMVAGIAIPIK